MFFREKDILFYIKNIHIRTLYIYLYPYIHITIIIYIYNKRSTYSHIYIRSPYKVYMFWPERADSRLESAADPDYQTQFSNQEHTHRKKSGYSLTENQDGNSRFSLTFERSIAQ
jgi:hypothetical protein